MTTQLSYTSKYTEDYSYMSKVFFYFGLAILTSAVGTYTGFTYLAEIFIANPISMYALFALELIIIFTSRLWAEKRPLNYLLFAAFAFITGVTIVPLLALFLVEFGSEIIIKALLATTFMFTATAMFGWTTKKSLSGLSGFLWAGLLGMIVVSVIGIFVPLVNTFDFVFVEMVVWFFLNLFIFILRLMGSVSRD